MDVTSPRRPRWGADHGAGIVDLLMVCAISVVVLGATTIFLSSSFGHDRTTVQRVEALDRASQGLELMQTELRQALELRPAVTVPGVSPYVEARLWVRTAPGPSAPVAQRWVRYDCSTASVQHPGTSLCARWELASPSRRTTLVDGVSSEPSGVFTLHPPRAPAVTGRVDLNIEAKVGGAAHPIVLRSTVTPRACPDGPPQGATTCPG